MPFFLRILYAIRKKVHMDWGLVCWETVNKWFTEPQSACTRKQNDEIWLPQKHHYLILIKIGNSKGFCVYWDESTIKDLLKTI